MRFRELPPVAPPVDVTDARAFPNIAVAVEYVRQLREAGLLPVRESADA